MVEKPLVSLLPSYEAYNVEIFPCFTLRALCFAIDLQPQYKVTGVSVHLQTHYGVTLANIEDIQPPLETSNTRQTSKGFLPSHRLQEIPLVTSHYSKTAKSLHNFNSLLRVL